MGKSRYISLCSKIFCFIGILLIIYVIFKYALGIVLPFILAFIIGIPIYTLSFKISKKIRICRKLCAFLILIIIVFSIGLIIFLLSNRIFNELQSLIEELGSEEGKVENLFLGFFDFAEKLVSKIPFIDKIEDIDGFENVKETLQRGISGAINGIALEVTSHIPAFTVRVIKGIPTFLVTLTVSIMACFYVAMDYGNIKNKLLLSLRIEHRERVENIIFAVCSAFKKYLRAYLIIFFMTLTEVFTGLIIMGKRFAFLTSFLIATVDILPVLGAGTVLIPWAVMSFFTNDFGFGTGLLILYGVITVIRQVAEPKIIGGSIGIHPLFTLFFMFSGLYLFGLWGMILAPAVLFVFKEIKNSDAKICSR